MHRYFLGISAAVAFSGNAFGETSAIAQSASTEVPRLTVSVRPFAGLTFGNQAHPLGSDIVMGSSTSVLGGLRVSPRWRVSNNDFAIGFSSSMAWLESHQISTTNWYDAQLAGRYYLGHARASQGWLDATVGAMVAV